MVLPPPVSEQADGAQSEGSQEVLPVQRLVKWRSKLPAWRLFWRVVCRGKSRTLCLGNDPLSPGPPSGKEVTEGEWVKIRLACLQLESEEQARQADHEFRLQIHKLEIEANTKVRL